MNKKKLLESVDYNLFLPTQNSEKVPNSCTQVTFMRNREQKRKMAPHEYFFRQKKIGPL